MTKYVVVDVSNLAHRTRHVIQRYDSTEELLAMILQLFFNSLNKTFHKMGGEHLVLCFDEGTYWRELEYPDYKLSRRIAKETRTPKEKEEDKMLYEMIVDLKEFFRDHTNATVLSEYGLEADDFCARFTQLHDAPDSHILVSTDSDFRQLVSDNVVLFDPRDQSLYTMDGVYHQDGLRPSRRDIVVKLYGENWKVKRDKKGEVIKFDPEYDLFFKCIRGDSSDYIKSAYPRVRETRLKEVFAKRGSLDWNKFLGEQWDSKDDSSPIVRDRYLFNKSLIDLTAQPTEIIELLDESIEIALDKKPTQFAGIAFGKFCKKHRLPNLMNSISKFGKILSSGYR